MAVIVWEGIIITVLVVTGLREAIMQAIPMDLKRSIGVGIGLFILFIGLAEAASSAAGTSACGSWAPSSCRTDRRLRLRPGAGRWS